MKRLIAALILAFAVTGIARAEIVGRVLLAAGDAVAIRAGKALPLTLGTMIEDKDTLRTGAASNLQVRFTDRSTMSLRENSELSIEDYRLGNSGGGLQKAFYRLLKGGLRTVTGLIGRTRHDEYRIDTVTSTIGIRGTHFALMSCQAGSCLNADGSKAKDGIYGGVTDGIVAATTKAGEYRFGAGETFFAPSIQSPVEKLIGPPVFLSDRLEGQKSKNKKQAGSEGNGASETTASSEGSGSEKTAKGGMQADSRPNTTPTPLPQLQVVTTNQLNPQGTPAVTPEVTPPGPVVLPPPNGWVAIYSAVSSSTEAVFDDNVAAVFSTSNELLSYGTAGTYPYGALNGGTIVDTGSYTYPNGQFLTWGRWTGSTQVLTKGGTTLTSVPVLFGTVAGLKQNQQNLFGGVATYTYVGGPKPVDAGGNVGTITSNSLKLDFTAQEAAFAMGVDFPGIGAVFTVSGIGTKSLAKNTGDFDGSLSGTCVGGGCASTSVTGGFSGGHDEGINGYELAVVGGGFYGTVAGPVVFLNAYQSDSYTPGPAPISNQTGWLAYGTPNGPEVAPILSPNFSGTNLIAYGDGINYPSGMLNSGTVAETGSATLVDGSTMRWGRWIGPSVQVIASNNVVLNPPTGVPYVVGDANAVLPTSGSFTYTYAGGPNPVDATGFVGTFNGGAFQVTFGPTSTIDVAPTNPLSLTVNGANFSLTTCTTNCTFTGSSPMTATVLSGTCSGGACGPTAPSTATGVGTGVFVGPQAAGLAVSGVITSPAPSVSFAAGFKRQ